MTHTPDAWGWGMGHSPRRARGGSFPVRAAPRAADLAQAKAPHGVVSLAAGDATAQIGGFALGVGARVRVGILAGGGLRCHVFEYAQRVVVGGGRAERHPVARYYPLRAREESTAAEPVDRSAVDSPHFARIGRH